MTLGAVSKHQIPLIMTFSEEDAHMICESLGDSLEEAYRIMDFFQFYDEEFDPFEE